MANGGAMMMDSGEEVGDKRGQKRNASDLSDEGRFALKRLKALSIQAKFHKRFPSRNGVLSTGFKRPIPPRDGVADNANGSTEGMDVDDTRDRVYIADLDAELSTSSSDDEDRLIFLPDIEKRFNRIPSYLYDQPRPPKPAGQQELVLYSDPKSLTVSQEQDGVRKAVLEARQRAREEAVRRQEDMERMYHEAQGADGGMVEPGTETAHGYSGMGYSSSEATGQAEINGSEDTEMMDLG